MLRNVLLILRGSLIAQAISYSAVAVLARLYSPEDFGRYQIFQSVLGFMLLSAGLRYEVAIINAETDEWAFSLGRMCFVLNATVSIVCLIICSILFATAPTIVGKLGNALWWLPILLFASGAFQTLTYLLLRSHAFKIISTAKGVQAIGGSLTGLGLGIIGATGFGLILADLVGKMMSLGYGAKAMIVSDRRYRLWQAPTHSVSSLLQRYREYPLISLPGSLMNSVGGGLAPLMIFGLFGAASSGQFALVDRCLSLPTAVIVQAVSQVYMASFSRSLREEGPLAALGLFKGVIKTHFRLGVIPVVALVFAGERIFKFVFGARWAVAGEIAQILSPLLLISFLVNPIDATLVMLNRQRLVFSWFVGRLLIVLASWWFVWRWQLNLMSAVKIHVAVNVAAYTGLLIISYRALLGARRVPAIRVT